MPKYMLTLTRTIVTKYDEVEIEADDGEAAQALAEQMVNDDELSEDTETTDYTSTMTELSPGIGGDASA